MICISNKNESFDEVELQTDSGELMKWGVQTMEWTLVYVLYI